MNGLNAPLSPVSISGSDWSGYPPMDNDGPYPNSRGQLISPPNSGGSSGTMNGGFPPGPRSAGGPSPPPSIGRSSAGTNLYARRDSARSQRDLADTEGILGEHYVALKRYLSSTSRDGKPNPPPNKARDKLQRLTSVQFLELSTDVFDELIRRQAFSRRPPNAPPSQGPPPYLLPEENFHPKRNQARQKLSSLGGARFRDLATDVFCELERRFPRFVGGDIPRMGSPASVRGLPSRSQTPLSSMGGFPPRGQSRVRRPSEASSIRAPAASIADAYNDVPPSPGVPPNNYERPLPKQFQSNTIVPNKSTMVEEDDDLPSGDGADRDDFGQERGTSSRESKKSGATEQSAAQSENDKRLIEDYEAQVRDLRDKLDSMEDLMKKKDDEMNNILDGERSRATAVNLEKKEWGDIRLDLENKLAEAQNLNDALRQELDRIRDDHAGETRQLREQMEDLQASAAAGNIGRENTNLDLERENDDLRLALREQQETTQEVRREAQEFLREMKILSDQSTSAWEKQGELEKKIGQLEEEVRDWRSRYARTKTQLRNMRASSLGLTIDSDAGKYVREKGFTMDNGLVKDVHVTKFQIAIDELLRRARVDDPEKVIDSMKAVVVSVRRITKDIDESAPSDEEVMKQQKMLKSRVSATANNLITASKNFAASAGISPVSLVDAAASHLVSAVVELLRTVKIRATPTGELEDDDDGTVTPVESTGFFSPRSNGQTASIQESAYQASLPPPPPFQGLGGNRGSVDSSAYSPINSPRESVENYRNPMSRGTNGNGVGYMVANKSLPPTSNGYGMRQDTQNEDLKIYLDDQTAIMVQTIQNLVSSIRGDADIDQISGEINSITGVISNVIFQTESSGNGGEMLGRLSDCRQRLVEAGERGQDLAADGKGPQDRDWRMWTQTLPPIAFEIARETKELVQRIDRLVGADDFA
ncbi:Protein SPA2 [Pleurostoma richardsiae]|uniref:Protein SPA2 n=1 Tax=Pleurostoma richardsiae TaxID=41990 RepID=A0AA38RPI8_9PEZI|nr:Protein SPA2 [Pleurostoma richardsiae]